jgi:hypothetical protein
MINIVIITNYFGSSGVKGTSLALRLEILWDKFSETTQELGSPSAMVIQLVGSILGLGKRAQRSCAMRMAESSRDVSKLHFFSDFMWENASQLVMVCDIIPSPLSYPSFPGPKSVNPLHPPWFLLGVTGDVDDRHRGCGRQCNGSSLR